MGENTSEGFCNGDGGEQIPKIGCEPSTEITKTGRVLLSKFKSVA